jgi:hypothetical protein
MLTPSFPSHPQPEDERGLVGQETPTSSAGTEDFFGVPVAGQPEQIAIEQPESIEEEAIEPPSPDSMLPPEARGEVNGGPLGCCLGVTVGLMFALLLGLIGFGHLTGATLLFAIHVDAITSIRIATGVIATVGALLGGYFGWKIGKRIYREYEPVVLDNRGRRIKRRPQPKEVRT